MWIWEIIEGTLLLQMAGLSFAVIVDPYLDKRQRGLMINIILLVTSLIFQNRMECVAGSMQTFWSVWGYIVRPVVIVLYILIVTRNIVEVLQYQSCQDSLRKRRRGTNSNASGRSGPSSGSIRSSI